MLKILSGDLRINLGKFKEEIPDDNEIINFEEFIAVKGIKALGNQLSTEKIKDINLLESLPYEEPVLEVQRAAHFLRRLHVHHLVDPYP